MTVDRELKDKIVERISSERKHFDANQTTFLTAGLFVVVSLTGRYDTKIMGMNGVKLVLILTVLSAIFFVFARSVSLLVWARTFNHLVRGAGWPLTDRIIVKIFRISGPEGWFRRWTEGMSRFSVGLGWLSRSLLLFALSVYLYVIIVSR